MGRGGKDKREELVRALMYAGLSRKLALTLICIAKHDEITSADIEKETGLRQPEVSITIQELEDRGWVERRHIKRGGRGRPANSYHLSRSLKDIMRNIEDEENRKIKKIKENIKRLKKLASKFP